MSRRNRAAYSTSSLLRCTCGKVKHYTIASLIDARTRFGADQTTVYFCEVSQTLHLTHRRLYRSYDEWSFALQAVEDIQRQAAHPAKLRIFKQGARWTVTYARDTEGKVIHFDRRNAA
jgi:hypothetical protein